jgi:hypothetical protein
MKLKKSVPGFVQGLICSVLKAMRAEYTPVEVNIDLHAKEHDPKNLSLSTK